MYISLAISRYTHSQQLCARIVSSRPLTTNGIAHTTAGLTSVFKGHLAARHLSGTCRCRFTTPHFANALCDAAAFMWHNVRLPHSLTSKNTICVQLSSLQKARKCVQQSYCTLKLAAYLPVAVASILSQCPFGRISIASNQMTSHTGVLYALVFEAGTCTEHI